ACALHLNSRAVRAGQVRTKVFSMVELDWRLILLMLLHDAELGMPIGKRSDTRGETVRQPFGGAGRWQGCSRLQQMAVALCALVIPHHGGVEHLSAVLFVTVRTCRLGSRVALENLVGMVNRAAMAGFARTVGYCAREDRAFRPRM